MYLLHRAFDNEPLTHITAIHGALDDELLTSVSSIPVHLAVTLQGQVPQPCESIP